MSSFSFSSATLVAAAAAAAAVAPLGPAALRRPDAPTADVLVDAAVGAKLARAVRAVADEPVAAVDEPTTELRGPTPGLAAVPVAVLVVVPETEGLAVALGGPITPETLGRADEAEGVGEVREVVVGRVGFTAPLVTGGLADGAVALERVRDAVVVVVATPGLAVLEDPATEGRARAAVKVEGVVFGVVEGFAGARPGRAARAEAELEVGASEDRAEELNGVDPAAVVVFAPANTPGRLAPVVALVVVPLPEVGVGRDVPLTEAAGPSAVAGFLVGTKGVRLAAAALGNAVFAYPVRAAGAGEGLGDPADAQWGPMV